MRTSILMKLNDKRIVPIISEFCIGEYVKIIDTGCQYSTYDAAFLYFWGDKKNVYLNEHSKEQYWKIINMAVHCSMPRIIYHIRNCKGENAVIGGDGIESVTFHKRNRNTCRSIVIEKLPLSSASTQKHNWKDKLWDFYENGNLIENKRKYAKELSRDCENYSCNPCN